MTQRTTKGLAAMKSEGFRGPGVPKFVDRVVTIFLKRLCNIFGVPL